MSLYFVYKLVFSITLVFWMPWWCAFEILKSQSREFFYFSLRLYTFF